MQRVIAVYGSLGEAAVDKAGEIVDICLGEMLPLEMIDTFQASAEIRRRIEAGVQYKLILLIPSMDELSNATQLLKELKADPATSAIPFVFVEMEDEDDSEQLQDDGNRELRASARLSSTLRRMN
jgi:CheY-like chemotaxis protein